MKTNEYIKYRREELNMTMKELANKVGVSEATISRWESGKIANMRRNTLLELANALKVEPMDLMDSDNAKDRIMRNSFVHGSEEIPINYPDPRLQSKRASNLPRLNFETKKALEFIEATNSTPLIARAGSLPEADQKIVLSQLESLVEALSKKNKTENDN